LVFVLLEGDFLDICGFYYHQVKKMNPIFCNFL
jgi:hypothetical protein